MEMRERALVIEADGRVCRLRINRGTACGDGCSGCGACAGSEVEICAVNFVGARVGDVVEAELDDRYALAAAALAYLLPLLFFIGGAAVAAVCGAAELVCAGIACASAAVGFLAARLLSKSFGEKFSVHVTQILSK